MYPLPKEADLLITLRAPYPVREALSRRVYLFPQRRTRLYSHIAQISRDA
ncbi:hypothetical protein [Enterobacter phage vB_ExiM_F5M1E]|nr:hypothetical protein [Enterobacter phage vB_ExiM_F1M1E]UNA03118.1 hypothetical protein [Enterobacter phage vB_ExiM_F2M1E]UNA03439.1 hypothetical protein [Enterobacter phage vB_ExiM_F4M1E]UNA03760.1 hypothetical protein [Enterobacter phage vB_ExiM_F5M1E]UNA04080.1 hypothetical protein [Pantoea phage vB_PdiM_F5M2A]